MITTVYIIGVIVIAIMMVAMYFCARVRSDTTPDTSA
jgi:heme/copper-type cytochrome/quinol oxidase subunit 2